MKHLFEMSSIYQRQPNPHSLLGGIFIWLLFVPHLTAQTSIENEIAALKAQNQALIEQLQEQQVQIEALRRRMETRESEQRNISGKIEAIRERIRESEIPTVSPTRSSPSRFILSGEAGIAFFSGQEYSAYPHEEWTPDDVRIFLEAEVSRGIYLITQWEMFRRESGNPAVEPGLVYIDLENPFQLTDHRELLNLRIGRFETPTGEEYQYRYVMENPLISHSVADLWGIDEGIMLYGSHSKFSYAVAIQNGSRPIQRDFTSDKSIAIRLAYDPNSRLRVSGSWMTTGAIDAEDEFVSEMWIGDVRFRPIGSFQTETFEADIAELDVIYRTENGRFAGHVGRAWYRDDDPLSDNSRELDFFGLEYQHFLTQDLYGAVRYSAIEMTEGYPLSGNGDNDYFFTSSNLSYDLRRLSLGLGYWLTSDAVFKVEYSFEDGETERAPDHDRTDQFAAELGVRF